MPYEIDPSYTVETYRGNIGSWVYSARCEIGNETFYVQNIYDDDCYLEAFKIEAINGFINRIEYL